MKKNFDIGLVDPLVFMGPNDKNIKLIENSFSAGIVVRGNTVKLDGDKNELEIISKILHNMLNTIEAKGHLEENDIQEFIQTTTIESKLISEDAIDKKIILHTYKGIVYAKTGGQKNT